MTALRDEIAETLAAARRANGGRLPAGMAKGVAGFSGYSTRTIRRDAARGRAPAPPTPNEPYELDDLARDLLALAHGKGAPAWRRLPKESRPSYATFMRAVAREISAATRADMAGGDADRRSGELTILRTYDTPFEVIVGDEKSLSIEVAHPETGAPTSPVVAHFRDAYSGAVVGAAADPVAVDRNDTLRGLGDACDPNSDIFPRGGTPLSVQWDQGTWHTADDVTLELCSAPSPIPIIVIDGYHPHQDGIVESFHNFVELDYCKPHPFYLHGRKRLDRTRYRPNYDALPSWEDFWADYRAWLRWYNHEWRQRLRGNKTPLEIWDAADSHPEPLDPARLARWLAR